MKGACWEMMTEGQKERMRNGMGGDNRNENIMKKKEMCVQDECMRT